MIENRYDVVVIGSGPAGSTAARYAAKGGASVLILERDREPGIPVRCAEGVSHKGLAQFIKPDPKWIAVEIDAARIYAPDGTMLELHNIGAGYILERRIFDRELCNLACAEGAHMLTKADAIGLEYHNEQICGVRYRHLGQEHVVKCDLVIGADGVESRVGRWAGIDTACDLEDIETSIQYTMTNIDADQRYCEFFFGDHMAPGGYTWIFPKSKTAANVGLGLSGNMIKDHGPISYLDNFVQKRFPNGQINAIVCGGIPTGLPLKDMASERIMLAGDAARQVNPMTGGGIITAMFGGAKAGETAAMAVEKRDFSKKFLSRYYKEWDKALGANHRLMYKMKSKYLHYGDENLNRLIAMCNTLPTDKLTLREIFFQAIKKDPILVAELAKAFVVSKLNV